MFLSRLPLFSQLAEEGAWPGDHHGSQLQEVQSGGYSSHPSWKLELSPSHAPSLASRLTEEGVQGKKRVSIVGFSPRFTQYIPVGGPGLGGSGTFTPIPPQPASCPRR